MASPAYKKIANQTNLKRILIFAPSMAIYLTTEFIRDLRKLFLPNYASKLFNMGSFSVNSYLLFVILDAIFVLSSLAIFGFSQAARKKLKNGQWNNLYYQSVKTYGLLLTFSAFIAVLVTARVFGVVDFTFAFFIVVLTSAILYINSWVTIIVDILCFILSFILIKIFKMDWTYNPYWAYIIVFMLMSTAIAYIKEKYLQEILERERTKSMFLANMSHEIRTPMNAIVGMSELAMDFNLKDSEKNILRQIRSAGINLVGIINDILDFSKIESGKMEIIPHDYDLVKMLNDIMNVVEVRLKGKPVELFLEIEKDLAHIYRGDEIRLRQILINLAGNATKFTEKGSIRIRVEDLKKYQPEKEGLRFSIIDTGIGIKKEDINKLFHAFQQVDMQTNRLKEGTGLGLSISRNLVNLMNGSLSLESEYGQGTTFYVNIPQKRISLESCAEFYKALFEAGKAENAIVEFSLSQLNSPEFASLFAEKESLLPFKAPEAKILVVDDNEVNLQVADGLLKKFGIKSVKAISGFQALDFLAEQKYDIIFMDHQMPGMDGVETLEKIRAVEANLPDSEKSIVIVLSANAVNGAREMFLSKGFNDFIAKPVQGKDFADCLSKYLKKELIIPLSDNADISSKAQNSNSTEENIIPKDFPQLPEDKINLKAAVELAGGFENWLGLARTFVNSIEEKAAQIQEYFLQEQYKDYTIQVHALKSSARIVGALKLSQMSEEEETEGNRLLSIINEEVENKKEIEEKKQELISQMKAKTEKLLECYRSYLDILGPVKKYGQKTENEKEELSEEELSKIIKALLSGCADFDLAKVEEEFALLQKTKLPENLAGKMEALSKAVENIEFEEIEELLK